MRNVIIVLIAVVMLIVSAGCTRKVAVTGVVTPGVQPRVKKAPDFNFISAEGELKSFRKVSQPISIIAFTSPSGEVCCQLIPELVELANRFKDEWISVAQISLPTSKCPHRTGCTEFCNTKDLYLIALCDENREAWNTYGQPKANTVILLDKKGRIVATESIDNLDTIARKAEKIVQEYDEVYDFMFDEFPS